MRAVPRKQGGRAGPALGEGDLLDVGVAGPASARLPMLAQDVPRDSEQIGAEAGAAFEAIARADAGREGLLDEVFGVVVGLVDEEAANRREVPSEQVRACSSIACVPQCQELLVGRHG